MLKAISLDSVKEQIESQANQMLGVPDMGGDMMMLPHACIDELFDEYAIIEMAETYWQANYTTDADGVATLADRNTWQMVQEQSSWIPVKGMVRAIKNDDGDWVLDILGVPYGGPFNGKDHDGEYFDAKTQLWLDQIGKRPIVHYHGYDTNGNPASEPEIIGQELSYNTKQDGTWFRVVLDKTKDTARQMWEAAQAGMARVSSGAIQHLVRRDDNGHIAVWPVGELSLMDISKGNYPANPYAVAMPVLQKRFKSANLNLTITEPEASAESHGAESPADEEANTNNELQQEYEMPTDNKPLSLEDIAAFLDKREADKAEAARIAALEAQAEELKTLKAQIAEVQNQRPGTQQINRLPNPVQTQPPADITVSSRYDGFTLGQLGLGWELLKAKGITPGMEWYRAMHAKAIKAIPQIYENSISRRPNGDIAREFSPAETETAVKACKAINPMQMADTPAMKSDEVMYSTLASYGNDWVPALWTPELWDLVRNGAPVLSRFRQVEVPGESLTVPTLAGRTTIYKTAQIANQSQLSETAATATMTKAQTSSVTLTPVKATAWVEWTGELSEDSIVPVLPSLQQALQLDIMEQIDEILISGDTDTANTNISDRTNGSISTSWHLLIANGLRDHALGNSNTVDIVAMDATKFLSVMGKLGTDGAFAIDPMKLFWLFSPGAYRTSLALGETLTAEKTGSVGTFQSGLLTRVYGSDVVVSDKFAKTDSSGYINNSGGSNTKGAFLLIRPDRWLVGFGRRITIETLPRDRIAIITDTNGLFASFRLAFMANGTAAASYGYNMTLVG